MLLGKGYAVHHALLHPSGQLRNTEVRNCSITEIYIPKTGPGEFVRMGDWQHLYNAYDLNGTRELADSTGN
jgi:hypothetical protein